jgi:hypothetical protein
MIPALGLPMIGGGGVKADPFSLSGSWESDAEGWNLGFATRATTAPRTGSWHVTADFQSITRTLTNVSGLTITVSAYHRAVSASVSRYFQYNIDGSTNTVLVSVADASTTYSLMTGSFNVPLGATTSMITFTILTGGGYWDDWAISGA